MKNNIILTALPESVEIGGKQYTIRYGFREWMQWDSIIDGSGSEVEKIEKLLRFYYPIVPTENLEEAIDKMLWFYRCGKNIEPENETRHRYQRKTANEPAYSFEQDAPYIYAAFLDQYGIDLAVEDMHWWKFMALFESLSEDTKMSKIMYYRKANTSGMSRDRRAFINEMKKLYKIRDSSGRIMTLEDRNRKWREYVLKRQNEIG